MIMKMEDEKNREKQDVVMRVVESISTSDLALCSGQWRRQGLEIPCRVGTGCLGDVSFPAVSTDRVPVGSESETS